MNEAATMFAKRAIEWAKESTQSVGWVERSDTHRRALEPHSIHRNAVLATNRRRCAQLVALVPIFPQEPHPRRNSYKPDNRSISEKNRSITRNSNKDAQQTGNSLDSRFDMSYGAALQEGTAALRANDLRRDSRDGRHDVLALQTLHPTIGYPREKLRLPDEFRRQRASGLHDGSFAPTQAELDALLKSASELKAQLEIWIAKLRSALA